MKLLIENWRQYTLMEEVKSGDLSNWDSWVTVDHLTQILRASRESEEPTAAKQWLTAELGKEGLKAIPGYGNYIAAADFLKDAYKQFKRSPEGAETAKDFPILDKLDVDPFLISTIDNDIMNEMDEEYEEYLTSLPGDTLVSDIVDINDYIRGVIAAKTQNHVVIRDENK